MGKLTKSQIFTFIKISIVILVIGFVCGYYAKVKIDDFENEKRVSLSNLMSEKEIETLKNTVFAEDTSQSGWKYMQYYDN